MSLFDIGKACVFSQVEGVVTKNGQPVAGAKVQRIANWQSEVSDATTTNEKGEFSFPAQYERSIMGVLPFEFVAYQKITLNLEGQDYLIWESNKRSEEENAELEGKPIQLACELNDEPSAKFAGRVNIFGICELK